MSGSVKKIQKNMQRSKGTLAGNSHQIALPGGGSRISAPAGRSLLDVSTNEEAYKIGFFMGQRGQEALDNITIASRDIQHTVLLISNAVIITEALPSDGQAQRLRAFFSEAAKDGFDKLLLAMTYTLERSINALIPFTNDGDITPYVNLEETARLKTIAAQVADAVYNLVDEKSPAHDKGESLHKVMQKYGRESIDALVNAISEKATKFGRETGVDEITRAIGENALDKVPKWGKKWTLIGKRHLGELEKLERPGDIDRKVIAKYRDAGYTVDKSGNRHIIEHHLLNTVRNAYRAVGGQW